jgi:hypothetical protein
MIALFDTFNSTLISKHFTLKNAVKAQRKHLKAVRKYNGKTSYLSYGFAEYTGKENDFYPRGVQYSFSGWKQIHSDEIDEIKIQLDNE